MDKPLSEMDKQLQDARDVDLVIANVQNRVKRNACVFFGVVVLGLILFFGWSKWLLAIPVALGIGSFLYQMNMVILSSELKRRSKYGRASFSTGDQKERKVHSEAQAAQADISGSWNRHTTVKGKEKEQAPDDGSDIFDAEALIAGGIAKRDSGDYVGAIRDFDRAIQLDPTDPKAYLERANAKRELKDERGAARDLETFKIMFDRLDEGIKANDTADAAYDSDDYEAAVRNYNRAVSLLPSLTSAYYRRGLAKLCLEDYQGAIDDFNKSIETNASNKAYAYHQRGRIKRHKLNDMKGAMQDFNEAIALCPNEGDFFFSRAKMSDGYDVFRDLNRAIELDPRNSEALFYRAITRHKMEDVEGAIQDLTRFIDLEPSDTDMSVSAAYSLRGSIRANQLDYAGALGDHDRAIQLDSSRASAYFDRGFAKQGLKDYEGAVLDFDQAIALDPTNALTYEFRGLARAEIGLQTEAEKDFSEARALGYSEEGG